MPLQVNDWVQTILDTCLREFVALNRPCKYLLTSVLSQKNGAGFRSISSEFWDDRSDCSYVVHWENEHMHCIVTIYVIALDINGPILSGDGATAAGATAKQLSQAVERCSTVYLDDEKDQTEDTAGV